MNNITPNLKEVMASTDAKSIQNAIALACETGVGQITIPAFNERTKSNLWVIDETVLLPSNITVVIDGAHLRLADGVFCNMFRNENMYTELRHEPEGEQHDIRIIGRGKAVLDGGVHNGLTERTSRKDGFPHIYHNSFILLHNVRDFLLEGFSMIDPRWWCVNLIYCRYGRISNLDVEAKDNYPNQDGIDLRCGCNNIIIENITGQGGDDLIALTGFQGTETQHAVAGRSIDIHTVTIRNIKGTSVTKAIVALRNQDGVKLYNILIDGIVDTSADNPVNAPYACLRIGQNAYVHTLPSKPGDTYNINAQNIHSCRNTAILLCATVINSSFRNLFACDRAVSILSTNGGAYLNNIQVENVFVSHADGENTAGRSDRCGSHNALFNFEHIGQSKYLEGIDRAENVFIRRVFADDLHGRPVAYIGGQAKIFFEDLHVNAPKESWFVTENGGEALE